MLESAVMIYLASNSPRRRQLLALGGWDFVVAAAPVDESVLPGETPQVYVCRLAEWKARSAQANLPQGDGWIIAADTTVADGSAPTTSEILGKPLDAADARRMLHQLRDRVHQVYTGVAVLRLSDGQLRSAAATTDVRMRAYTDAEIEAYIASGDPLDKAGAYAIQHPEFHPVQDLHGCYSNVMGLPVCLLARLMAELTAPPAAEIVGACQPQSDRPCPLYCQAVNDEQCSGNVNDKI